MHGDVRAVRPLVEQYELADGRRLNLLAQGRVVNLAAAEGHPAAVMDVSFALQALSVEELVTRRGRLRILPKVSTTVAMISAAAPYMRQPGSATTKRPVFFTEVMMLATSSGIRQQAG